MNLTSVVSWQPWVLTLPPQLVWQRSRGKCLHVSCLDNAANIAASVFLIVLRSQSAAIRECLMQQEKQVQVK